MGDAEREREQDESELTKAEETPRGMLFNCWLYLQFPNHNIVEYRGYSRSKGHSWVTNFGNLTFLMVARHVVDHTFMTLWNILVFGQPQPQFHAR